ncbi:MAG: polysaccharide biosynthesis protein [Bacteroidaceae bacterium]|nr:polysaccharide biosynthesis protein [Bacteroidaceae bacterium]
MSRFNKIVHWYFSKSALPYWGIVLLDCMAIYVSGLVVAIITDGPVATFRHMQALNISMAANLLCYIVGMKFMHTYSGVLRHSSFVDLLRVCMANLIGVALTYPIRRCLTYFGVAVLGYYDLVALFFIATFAMWGVRIFVKYIYEIEFNSGGQRVFIYGTRDGGISIAKSIRNDEERKYVLAGFVSTDNSYIHNTLMGVKVVPNDPALVDKMKAKGADILLVSPLCSDRFRAQTELVDKLVEANIRIHMMPPTIEWDGKSALRHEVLREVEVEDLLPREKIEVDMERIGKMLCEKRILITGAAGSIGSEIVRQIAVNRPAELVLIDQAETPMHDVRIFLSKKFQDVKAHTIVANICNRSRMEELFKEFRPEYVFHAAAYKHVPMMEDNPSEAVQNNIYGTRVIADLAVKYGTTKFVMISTDKAVNPTNVMGCSKRICEIYVQSLDKAIKEGKVDGVTQFVTTRFGNVLGSNGSVIPIFKEQIKNGGPVTVTHPDIIRYFMLIPEACKLVLEAGTMGKGGEIYVFDMGQPVRIADLAQRMIHMSGAKDVEIAYSGLRDGEKLYEELLNDMELTKPTHHPKIKIATVREYDYEAVCLNEEELYQLSFSYDAMAVVKKMKQIVPEFKSQHSRYEVLDC